MQNEYHGLSFRRRGDPEGDENDSNDGDPNKRIKLEPESDEEQEQLEIDAAEDIDEATSTSTSEPDEDVYFQHEPLRLYDENQLGLHSYNNIDGIVDWVRIFANIECFMVNFGSFKVDLNSSSASQNEYESINLAITNLSVQIDIVTQLKSIMINFPISSVICLKVSESTSGPSSLFFELNDQETVRLQEEFGLTDNFDSIEGGKFIKISTQLILSESFLSKIEDIFIEKLQFIGEVESDCIFFGHVYQPEGVNLISSTGTGTSPSKPQSSHSTDIMTVQNSLLAIFSENVDVLARINCLMIKIGKYMVPVINKEGNFQGKIEIVITRQSVKIDIEAPNMIDPSTQLKGKAFKIQFHLSSIVSLKVHHSGGGKNIFFFELCQEESPRIRNIFNLTPDNYSPNSSIDNIQAKFIKILIKDKLTPECISDLKEIFESKLEFISKYESSVLDGYIPKSKSRSETETVLSQSSDNSTVQDSSSSTSVSVEVSSLPPPLTSTAKKISINIEEVLKINCFQFNIGKYHAAGFRKECLDKISLIITNSGNIRIHFEDIEENNIKTIIDFPIASVVSLKVRIWEPTRVDVFFFELNLEQCLKIKNQLKIDEKDFSHFAPDENIRARYIKLWLNHLTEDDYEKLGALFNTKLKFIDVVESDFLNGTVYKAKIKRKYRRLPPPAPIFSQEIEENDGQQSQDNNINELTSKTFVNMLNCYMVKLGQYRVSLKFNHIGKINLMISSQKIIIDINTPNFFDRVTKKVGTCIKIELPISSILSFKMFKSPDYKNILFFELNQDESSKLRKRFNLSLDVFSPESTYDYEFITSKYLKILTSNSLTVTETQKVKALFGKKFKFVDVIESQILDGTRPRPKSKIVKILPNEKQTWKRKADLSIETLEVDKNSKMIQIIPPKKKMSKPSIQITLENPTTSSKNPIFLSPQKISSPSQIQLQSPSSNMSISPTKSLNSPNKSPCPITLKCKQIYFGLYLFEGEIEIILLPGIKSLNILLKSEEGNKSTHRLPGDPNIKYFYSTKVSHADNTSGVLKKNLTFCIDGNLTDFVVRILKSLSCGKLIHHFYNRQSTELSMKYITMIVEESVECDLNEIENNIIQTFGEKCQNMDCILFDKLNQDLLELQPMQSFVSEDSADSIKTVHLSCKWVKAGDYMVCAKSKNEAGYIDVRISDKMVLIDVQTPQFRDRVTNLMGRECSFGFPVSSIVQAKFNSFQSFSSFFLQLTPEECEKIKKCLEFDRRSLKFAPKFDPTLPDTDGNRYFKFETIPYQTTFEEKRDFKGLQKLFESKFEVIDCNTAHLLNGRVPKVPKSLKVRRALSFTQRIKKIGKFKY